MSDLVERTVRFSVDGLATLSPDDVEVAIRLEMEDLTQSVLAEVITLLELRRLA